VLALGEVSPDEQLARSSAGKPAWGALTVIRALLLFGPLTQTRLAEVARVSQPRVSQILTSLDRDDLVSRNPLRVPDWDRLVDHWLSRYPGPGGVQTHWYGVAPPGQQTRTVIDLLRQQHDDPQGDGALVSGDVAADHLTPWGRAGHSVVYARHGADLHGAKLTACRAQDATLTLIVPHDPGIWTLPTLWWTGPGQRLQPTVIPLADPLQILTDLLHSRTIDADQTARRLRGMLRLQVRTAAEHSDGPEDARIRP
jgi:Crp-like helix-turn-helix domain